MLSTSIFGLLAIWICALLLGATLGGWIHLLPLAALPLLIARVRQRDKPGTEYQAWVHARARRARVN